MKRHFS
jgi:hypothetical protein